MTVYYNYKCGLIEEQNSTRGALIISIELRGKDIGLRETRIGLAIATLAIAELCHGCVSFDTFVLFACEASRLGPVVHVRSQLCRSPSVSTTVIRPS
jgi:hypothetical protein